MWKTFAFHALLYIRVPSAFINSNSIIKSTQIASSNQIKSKIPQQLSTAKNSQGHFKNISKKISKR